MTPGMGTRGLWQHPFVDVFKTFHVDEAERRGDVSDELDRDICKRVFSISGSVSANNFLRLPAQKGPTKSLSLTGEYIYLQVKPKKLHFFMIHLDFTVTSFRIFRVSLSNIFPEAKASYHALRCPCALPEQWTTVCLHVPSVLARAGMPGHAYSLKGVQFCSVLTVRNVFTSDNHYSASGLPKDLILDLRNPASCAWLELPHDLPDFSDLLRVERGGSAEVSSAHDVVKKVITFPTKPLETEARPLGPPADKPLKQLPEVLPDPEAEGPAEAASLRTETFPDPLLRARWLVGASNKMRRLYTPGCDEKRSVEPSVPYKCAIFLRKRVRKELEESEGSLAGLDMQLGSTLVLAGVSSTLVLIDLETQQRRCILGYNSQIEQLEGSDDGLVAVSVQGAQQEGCAPTLRIWRVTDGRLRCVCPLPLPTFSGIKACCFDRAVKQLGVAGVDLRGKQVLQVWDISRVDRGGSATLVVRQTSPDWDIDCLRFSPFEESHLVSCGRKSVRFWRMKAGRIPGQSVVLSALARQEHYTCIAFEHNRMGSTHFLGDPLCAHVRVFVGSSSGKVLQISYTTREVQAVLELHTSPVTALYANEGFLVSASMDKYVRVWPLDFKSYYLQVMHDSPVTGLDLAPDGLQVLCSTMDGSVGLLELKSHDYQSLLHGHTAEIREAAVSSKLGELATIAQDGTIKVWKLETGKQAHEFVVTEDRATAVEFHPTAHTLAVGFQSGALRVFDIDSMSVLVETRHHSRPVRNMAFIPLGEPNQQLVTCDTTGSLAFYNASSSYAITACPGQLTWETPPVLQTALACTAERLLLYVEPHAALLHSLPSLEIVRKLRVSSGAQLGCLAFSACGRTALLASTDGRVFLHVAKSGAPIATVPAISPTLRCVRSVWLCELTGHQGHLLLQGCSDGALQALRLPALGGPTNAATPTVAPLEGQSILGHSAPATHFRMARGSFVSVSPREVICWSVQQPELCGDTAAESSTEAAAITIVE